MKRFRFRLARVLAVRRLAERQARATFLEARARSLAARAEAEAARAEHERGQAFLSASQSSPWLRAGEVIAQQAAIEALRASLRRRESQAHALEQAAEIAKEAWESARAAVRGLERPEERRGAAHRAELERAEGRALDELTLARGARSQGGNPPPILAPGAQAAGSSAGAPPADPSPSTPGPASPPAGERPFRW